MSLERNIMQKVKAAAQAALRTAALSASVKNRALMRMARALMDKQDYLLRENQKDLRKAAKSGLAKALVDRLALNPSRIRDMADCLKDTAKLEDPVGAKIRVWKRPNGMVINKVRTPIGVIGIIYESRPNVTSDCIGICLKSGNAVILKGGKEAIFSNRAILKVLRDALTGSAVPADAIHLITSTQRDAVKILLKMNEYVDLIIPRGGEGLIRFVTEHSRIPVVKHYKGVCHTYVSDNADIPMARSICFNAKVQRPGVCNAMETMLVHKDIAKIFLPLIAEDMIHSGVEMRGCARTRRILKEKCREAKEEDWSEEYLALILAVKVVDSTQDAIRHINTYGSKHSDAIVSRDRREAQRFLQEVDSSCLYWNASTRFTDGYQFGFGAEVGISTDKLHARGPMALEELTTYKYVIEGKGQVRI